MAVNSEDAPFFNFILEFCWENTIEHELEREHYQELRNMRQHNNMHQNNNMRRNPSSFY